MGRRNRSNGGPNIDLSFLAGAMAGSPELKSTPSNSQNSMMMADASGASDMGSGYKPAGSRVEYPQYERPSFAQRMFNPQGANNADRFNAQSQLSQSESATSFNNQIAAREHELTLQSMREVLKREGLTPEQIEKAVAATSATRVNRAQTGELQSATELDTNINQPSAYKDSYLADLAKQGVNNRVGNANAATTEAQIPFIADKSQAEINNMRALTDSTNQKVELGDMTMPYDVEQAKNAAMQSGIIKLPQSTMVGNLPEGPSYFNITGEQHSVPGSQTTFTDPNTGQPISVGKAPVPYRPSETFKVDPFNSGEYPVNRNTNVGGDVITLPDGRVFRKRMQ